MEVTKTKMTADGRIGVPVRMRKRHNFKPGGTIHLIDDENGILISTPEIALRRLQKKFAKLEPEGVSLVDELIAERRKEAAND